MEGTRGEGGASPALLVKGIFCCSAEIPQGFLHPGLQGELLFGSFLVGFTLVLCGFSLWAFSWREGCAQGNNAIKSSSLGQPLLHGEVSLPQNLVFTKATFNKEVQSWFSQDLRVS